MRPGLVLATLPPSVPTRDDALDEEDRARILLAYRGQTHWNVGDTVAERAADRGQTTAYVFDEDLGMVFIVD